jgi:hypothetical protein
MYSATNPIRSCICKILRNHSCAGGPLKADWWMTSIPRVCSDEWTESRAAILGMEDDVIFDAPLQIECV